MSSSTIKLGLMPPLTGLVGIYGSEISRAARIACEEVNQAGGVLGRPLELVIEDDGSLPETAVAAATKLIDAHGCVAIIGNLLSNSRISVAYRVAEPRRIPYLNFSFYEGSILSRYFFHFAALPNQQIDRMIPYMCGKFGSRMFFAGSVEAEALVDALNSIRVTGPQGAVVMDPAIQHATVNTYLSRCNADGVFDIVESFGAIAPVMPERYSHQRVDHRTTLEEDIRLQARMLEQMTEGVMLVSSRDGTIVYANAGAERMFGYDKGELLGKPMTELHSPESRASAAEISRILNEKGRWQGETQNRCKDGSSLWCSVTVSSFTHPVHGEVGLSVHTDISAHQCAEKKMQQASELLHSIVENIPLMIFTKCADDLRFTLFNRAGEELLGMDRAALLGKNDFDLFPRAQAEFFISNDRRVLNETGFADISEEPIDTAKLGRRLLHTRKIALKDSEGNPTFLLGISEDITERKQAEHKLVEQEAQLRAIVDGAFDGILMVDVETRKFTFGNAAICRMLGVTPQQLLTLGMEDLQPSQSQGELGRQFEAIGPGETTAIRSVPLLRRDGQIRLVDISGSSILVNGRRFNLGIFRDITDQQRSKRAVREQARLLNHIFEYSQDCMAILDRDYNFVRVTDSYARAGGRELWEYEGKNHFEMYPSDFKADADEARRSKVPYHKSERPFVFADHPEWGTTYWDVDFVPVLDAEGEVELFLLTIKDVTKRKLAEDALRTSEARLRAIIDMVPVPVALNDGVGRITYLNRSFTRTFGYDLHDIPTLAEWWPKAYPEESYRQWVASAWQEELERAASAGTDFEPMELKIRCKDGDERIALASVASMTDDVNIVVLLDLSGIKRAESAMRESEARLNEAQRIARVGSWELDLQRNELHWSDEIYRLFELDRTEFGASYEAFLAAIHPDDREAVNAAYTDSLHDRQPYRITHRLRMADGRVKHVEEQCESVFAPDGTPIFSRGTVQDVTERVLADERIRQSLLEKETLLREIHHRVKNNLQVVASLLHFHAKKLHDATSIEVFADVRAQLRSMMLVHEKLYRSGDLAHVDFGDYLRSLVSEIGSSRGTKTSVQLSVEAAEIFLSVDTAMPCGLLVSELLTNALKHAFPNGRSGHVNVSASLDAGALKLCVDDDGVGMPQGFDPEGADTFGWKIIHGLAAQVGGTLNVGRERGTVVCVVIPMASEGTTS